MEIKPEKRWVHKGEYRGLVRRRVFCCASGVIGVFLYVGVNCFFNAPTSPVTDNTPFHPGIFWGALMIIGAIIAILAELSQIFGFLYQCFKAATEVESVRLITPRNHHLAPPVETLVRASDLPSTHKQTELLRAAPQGSDTPAEELLRASTNRKGG